jgi:hypothetical protein
MGFEIGQRVFRVGSDLSCGATVVAIDRESYTIEYDEGGAGSWPQEALAASLAEAVTESLDDLKESLTAAVADLRRAKEVGAVSVASHSIMADERSRANLTAATLAAVLDAQYAVRWKMADGAFVDFSASEIIAAAQAVRAHVQACFDREKALSEEIGAAQTVGDLAAIDLNSGWPV